MHTAPALVDGDVKIWECRAILRYICNKHKLEDFYPSDPAKRANIDCALDWNMGSMNPIGDVSQRVPQSWSRCTEMAACERPSGGRDADYSIHPLRPWIDPVGTKMYYPWLGYAPHCTDEEFKAAEERWTKELEPSVQSSCSPCPLDASNFLKNAALQLALLIKNGGPGPFIGGAQPCIADFAIIG